MRRAIRRVSRDALARSATSRGTAQPLVSAVRDGSCQMNGEGLEATPCITVAAQEEHTGQSSVKIVGVFFEGAIPRPGGYEYQYSSVNQQEEGTVSGAFLLLGFEIDLEPVISSALLIPITNSSRSRKRCCPSSRCLTRANFTL